MVDQHVAERRLALQKTKQLHKQLDEMKPNSYFSSGVQRTLYKDRSEIRVSEPSGIGRNAVAKATGLKTIQVDRPGQDDGYIIAKQLANTKNQTFNSTSPRFMRENPNKQAPGPGSYETSYGKTFQSNQTATSINHSVFRDTTQRMDDPRGYRGFQRTQNPHGPGQYTPKQPFLRKTFNTTLPLGNFV